MNSNGGSARGARLIRPYTMTGGRTGKEMPGIELEALVTATAVGLRNRDQFRWEASRLLDLTRAPVAVVELAARLDVPIGVARVLVGDLATKGAVDVRSPRAPAEEAGTLDSYADLLRKVLDGIKSL